MCHVASNGLVTVEPSFSYLLCAIGNIRYQARFVELLFIERKLALLR
jgi:hypothetical protein